MITALHFLRFLYCVFIVPAQHLYATVYIDDYPQHTPQPQPILTWQIICTANLIIVYVSQCSLYQIRLKTLFIECGACQRDFRILA